MKVNPRVDPSVKSGKVMAGKAKIRLDGDVKDGRVDPFEKKVGHWEEAWHPNRYERNEERPDLEEGGFNEVEQVFYPAFCEPDYHKRMAAKEVKKGEGKPDYMKKAMTSKATKASKYEGH